MKKIFMTLAVAGMVAMASCGGDKKDGNSADSSANNETKTEEVAENNENESTPTTVNVSSASELESEVKENGWKLNDNGDLVDAYGKIIKTYKELSEQVGAKELGDIAGAYGTAIKALDDLDDDDINSAMGSAEAAAKLAGKAVELSNMDPEDIDLDDMDF